MKFIQQDAEGIYQLANYIAYLETVRNTLPHGARGFVFTEERYNFSHPQCLHDSWVTKLALTESESKVTQIELILLGSYHDGHHKIIYEDVRCYELSTINTKRGSLTIGHGDWIVDEVLLTEEGLIAHEIEFSDSARWRIVAKDMTYSWIKKGN